MFYINSVIRKPRGQWNAIQTFIGKSWFRWSYFWRICRWRKTVVVKVSKLSKKVTDSITLLWITSDLWNVLKSWLKHWKSSLHYHMDKHLLKEASVLTNPSLWKICQSKAWSLNCACTTTWSQTISALKISLFVVRCVKATEFQESSMRITLKSREKQNQPRKEHLSTKPSRKVSMLWDKRKHCWKVQYQS